VSGTTESVGSRPTAQRAFAPCDGHAVYRAPRSARAVPARAFVLMIAACVVSPIDLVPDFIPALGQVDDAILGRGILIATRLMPPEALDEHRRRCDAC
jgi:uncharacterized membrane protein YkvA (DUF1232 family)